MIRGKIRNLRDKSPLGGLITLPFSILCSLGIPVPHALYQHLPFRGELTVALPEGMEFRMLSRGEALENGLYWRGIAGWEPEWLPVWLALCQSARGVVDIGANTGLYSLMGAAANPKALIKAFEPVSRIADRLEENIKLNHFENVAVFRCAIGETSGEVQLYDPGADIPYSASIDPNFLYGRDASYKSHGSVYPVSLRTLDDVLSSETIPTDLVKVDAEGVEIQVLRGAARTLVRWQPTLLLEYLKSGTELDTLIGDMMKRGYRLFHPGRVGLREIFEPRPASDSWNVLLHHKERPLPSSIQVETSQ